MKNKMVIDSSALLALLNGETGKEIVEEHLPLCIISAVNLSEVVAVLVEIGMPPNNAQSVGVALVQEVIVFDEQHAFLAASLKKITKSYGLSFGDRACLALAHLENIPVLTADKVWKKLESNQEIILIR